MAFGGTATAVNPPASRGNFVNRAVMTGLTLAARAGAFDIAAADSGRLTTDQTPAANHTAIPGGATWGPGEAGWETGDENAVEVYVEIAGDDAAAQPPNIVGKRVNAGNLEVDFHNAVATIATGVMRIGLRYLSTLEQ